jgi:NAD(P)-dependent dehydrogenase (short-subunit alcohol dehydrogenase family)
VTVAPLDLADLSSVRAFAEGWGRKPLHILVNNAGVMACDLAYTRDDFEMQFGTNHLGHSLLTLLLAPALERAAERGKRARVVQVSSGGHRQSDIHWDDPHYRSRAYDRWEAYGQSKTANILFALGFNERFKDRGVNANALHPGGIRTNLQRHVTPEERARRGWAALDGPKPPGMKTPEQGASTSVWAALAPELEGVGGRYFENCAEAGEPDTSRPYGGGVWPWALNPESADRLWALTATMIGVG